MTKKEPEKMQQEEKKAVSPTVLIGISAAAAVIIISLIVYFRKSDPAASGPIPYQKIDYGAHMQQTQQQYMNRQNTSVPHPSQSNRPR